MPGFFMPKGKDTPMSTRVQLTTVAAPKLVQLVRKAARQSDAKVSEYLRSALVQKLQRDGHDVASALAMQD
jgi:hypothetical protein